jgi:hypothetical protein
MKLSKLCLGRIVWAIRPDPNGQNSKCRPWIILTATDEISEEDPFVAVAISSQGDIDNSELLVELPWGPGQKSGTKLSRWSAAVCNWFAAIHFSELTEDDCGGIVPAKMVMEINKRIQLLSRSSDAKRPTNE